MYPESLAWRPLENLPLEIPRDDEHTGDGAVPHQRLGFADRRSCRGNPEGLVLVGHPHEPPAEAGMILVDDGDRHVPHHLVEVGHGIEEGIHDNGQHRDDQHAGIEEHEARLVGGRGKQCPHDSVPCAAARDSRARRQTTNGHGAAAKAASTARLCHDAESGAPLMPCCTSTRR